MSLNTLSDLLAQARRAGADAADTILYASTSVSVERRLGQMETLERSEAQDLGLRVFVGQRSAIVSASSVDPSGFAALAARAVAMARVVPEDPYSALCDLAAAPEDFTALDLVDEAGEPDLASLIDRAQTAEEAALQVPGRDEFRGRQRRLFPPERVPRHVRGICGQFLAYESFCLRVGSGGCGYGHAARLRLSQHGASGRSGRPPPRSAAWPATAPSRA